MLPMSPLGHNNGRILKFMVQSTGSRYAGREKRRNIVAEHYEPSRLRPRHQWYWSGTQDETKRLTPDLKHAVQWHIVVTRVISVDELEFSNTRWSNAGNLLTTRMMSGYAETSTSMSDITALRSLRRNIKRHFSFHFVLQVSARIHGTLD